MVSFFTTRFDIVLVSIVLLFLHVHSTTHWQDVEVLKQLKNSVDPTSITPGSCLASWDFSLDPCDNLFTGNFTCGFRCDVAVSSLARVTELALDHWGYSGSLTSVSWNHLPYLQTLDLTGNSFHGSIPDSLSHLLNLRRITLSRNLFSGSIPPSLGSLSGLEELYLDYNNLEGTVPSSINRLNNLKRLDLQANKLTGVFPQLPQLNSLYFLDVSNNRISGDLPATLPPSLVQLSMRNNTVEGNIPATVTALLSLEVLDLSHNKLSGSIPAALFTHPTLQQLTISHNQFGSIDEPAWISFHDSQLIAADLSNNDISGFLPGFMGLMPRLSSLSLENNKLSGIIPTQYAMKVLDPGQGVSRLERLLLGSNYLSGAIPGPLLDLKPGSVKVRLGDNCLYRCPLRIFLCEGGKQKSLTDCKALGHIIP